MMTAVTGTFVSYAQNREDVVLWRALSNVGSGRYVEVGANHPRTFSVTRGFYEQGWSGVTVEPVPDLVALHRIERPRDHQVQAAVTDAPAATVTLHVIGQTGLSTLDDQVRDRHASHGFTAQDLEVAAIRLDEVFDQAGLTRDDPIHFVVVDVEGAEPAVLRSVDLTVWRPWVFVVEATAPRGTQKTHDSWEHLLTDGGYRFCLFDGLSRFYVAEEHADLAELLSYPACPLDEFDTDTDRTRRDTIEALTADLLEWRGAALNAWADAVVAAGAGEAATVSQLRTQLDETYRTVSWRVTAPLRAVRRLIPR